MIQIVKAKKEEIKNDDIVLIKPTIQHKQQAKEMMEEARKYDAENPDIWAGYASICETYEEWLQKLENDLGLKKIYNYY